MMFPGQVRESLRAVGVHIKQRLKVQDRVRVHCTRGHLYEGRGGRYCVLEETEYIRQT